MANTFSRRERIEKARNLKKAFALVVLTISTIIAFVFYGFPAIAKVVLFYGDIKNSSEPVELSDTTPPPPPTLDSLPESTNESEIILKGRTEPGATVIIELNSNKDEILADKSGDFTYKIKLKDGNNTISVISKDSSNNESHSSKEITITLDTTAPDLEITKPQNGAEFYGSKERQITIEGKTEENITVRINGRFVVLGSDGSFSFYTSLSEGANEFKVTSEDRAGNSTEQVVNVVYYP